MKRIEILKASLQKKEERFNTKLSELINDVKKTNGQPLNDKKNGIATMTRWDKQNAALRSMQKEIEKTKLAIAREENKTNGIKSITSLLPEEIVLLINDGTLKQWGKYPHIFFVKDVDKARLIYDFKKKQIAHKYTHAIQDKAQYKKFAQIFNSLSKQINK